MQDATLNKHVKMQQNSQMKFDMLIKSNGSYS